MELEAVELAGNAAEISLFHLFWQADIIVKAVMLMLIAASVWSWTIIIEKTFTLRSANKGADAFDESFWSGGSLEQLFEQIGNRPGDPMQAVFVSAMREWRRSAQSGASGFRTDSMRVSIQQRVERSMEVAIAREMSFMERQMVFLATVGSAGPFIGLFGTVWGIMNAFTAISNSGNTNLSVVAPGIAEALFATALGLVAAIPATIAYNKIATDLNGFAARLEAFQAEFSAILSRQLDVKG